LCDGCGQDKHVAWTDRPDSYFDVRTIECQACKAKQEYQNSTKEPQPGAKLYVVEETGPPSGPRADHDPGHDQADAEQAD